MRVEGRIAEAKWDGGRQLVRVEIAQGEEGPVLTDWIEKMSIAMGGAKIDVALSVGEMVTIDNSASGGEITPLSRVVGSGTNDSNATPAGETDGLHLTFGGARIQIGADGVLIENGGASIRLNGGKVTVNGSELEVAAGAVSHQGKISARRTSTRMSQRVGR